MLNAAVKATITLFNPKNIDPEVFLIKIGKRSYGRSKQTSAATQIKAQIARVVAPTVWPFLMSSIGVPPS
jgi:hypothetical protein